MRTWTGTFISSEGVRGTLKIKLKSPRLSEEPYFTDCFMRLNQSEESIFLLLVDGDLATSPDLNKGLSLCMLMRSDEVIVGEYSVMYPADRGRFTIRPESNSCTLL